MSYMYTRKHYKRTVQSEGTTPDGKIPLSIDDKGGEIYHMQRTEAWFQREQIYQMQRIEANLSDIEDRGMVPGGV
jgi:hypothetical protein